MVAQRRWRVSADDEVKHLVESLTMDQLRTAAAMIARGAKLKFTTKEEAKTAFDLSGEPRNEAVRCLRLVEARTPGKHLMFFPLLSSPTHELVQQARARITSDESSLSFIDVGNDEVFFTFEYEARFSEWVATTPDGKKKELRDRIVRHPNVARVVSRQGEHPYCVFTYQGFGHGSSTEDYAAYVGFAKAELEELGCSFLGFAVKGALEALVDARSRKFTVYKGTGRGALGTGSFSFSSDSKNTAVENVLGPELAKHLDGVSQDTLRRAFALAIQSAPADSYVLFWNELKVTTRIEFCSIGTDFLVTWTDTNRSFTMIDQIFRTLYAAMERTSAPTAKIWSSLLALESGHVTKLSDIASTHVVSNKEAQNALQIALTAGIVEAVFNVRDTEHLVEPVSWTVDLVSLRREFYREDGGIVDGADPSQIIVGFRRVPK